MERAARVTTAIYDAIDHVNRTRGARSPLDRSPDTVLIGESGALDSLSFLTFGVAVVENVERTLGTTISLEDLIASAVDGPCTVGMLADHLACLVGAGRPRSTGAAS